MKNKIKLILAASLLSVAAASAQTGGVGVGTTTPDASSALDVTSTTKGFLMPRMTTAQRTAIATPATGLQVYDTTTNSQWFYNGTVWVEGSNSSNGLWKQDTADQISLTFPNANEEIKYTNKGFKSWDKLTLQHNAWDGTALTIVNKDYRTTGNSGNSYNNWFTLSDKIVTEDATNTGHIANYNQLSISSSETRANKQFFSSNNVVQVESSNSLNITGLRGSSNTASHFGTGTVSFVIGASATANVFGSAKATTLYGGFFVANANSSNTIPNLIGSYSNINVNLAQTGAITNAYAIQSAINFGSNTNTNITNLVSLRTGLGMVPSYSGTITNYYDIYSPDVNTTAPGTITNKFGLFILGATKRNYLEGSLGIGTTTPTSKLQVVGLPVHVDNAAAVTAGLTAGAFYHSGDGIVRVVY